MADCCWPLEGSGLGDSALYNLLWCEMEMVQPRNNTHNRNFGKLSGRLYPPHSPLPRGGLAKPATSTGRRQRKVEEGTKDGSRVA